MSRRGQDTLFGVLMGLFVGALPAMLTAGAFVTWKSGGDLRQIDFLTYFRLLPSVGALAVDGDYKNGALIGIAVMLAAVVGGIALAWRKNLNAYGTARWAQIPELRRAKLIASRLKDARGPIWGKFGRPRARAPYLSSPNIIHSLVAAPTGAGKGVGVVIPSLLTYPGSTVVLDVKGENYEQTARARHELGDRIYKFAPFATDRRSHCYNPFDVISAAPERRRFAEALRLANSLLAAASGTESWVNGSREIFAATALVAQERGQTSIAGIYDLLSVPAKPNELMDLLARETASGEARSIFNRYAGLPDRVLGSYLSIMFEAGLRLWANPDVRDATAHSDFRIENFRADPSSVYICVSQKDLDVLSPLIRLMFQQMFTILQETERVTADRFDVLFLLDEFASLGKMDELSRAITTVRSSGAHLMLIVQSLANLHHNYGKDGAANFMGNCELQLFMAPTDTDTPKYISEAIGDQTRVRRSKSWRQRAFEPASVAESQEGARLIRPEQIRLLGPDAAIALVRDLPPVAVQKVAYYADREIRRRHERQSKTSFAEFEPAELIETARTGTDHPDDLVDATEIAKAKGEPAEQSSRTTAATEDAVPDTPAPPVKEDTDGGSIRVFRKRAGKEAPTGGANELKAIREQQGEILQEIDNVFAAARRQLHGK